MNWEAIGAIGDLVGGFAVIATLIYLAIQVRHSKELLERNERIALSQVYQSRADSRANIHLAQAQSGKSVSKVWGRPEGLDELDEEEQEMVRQFMLATYVNLDNVLYQASLDLLDDEALNTAKEVVSLNLPVWEKLGIPISTRVRKHYRANKECESDT